MDKDGNELPPFFIGIFFPTYKDLSTVWQKLLNDFHDGIESKNEQLKQIFPVVGGRIDFWSMSEPDSGRGLDYDRVILDEFAKAKKNEMAWKHTIRPTLTDRKGDAWIFSTPKGKRNYFYRLQTDHIEDQNWSFHKFTTYDNPYLDEEEIDEAKNQLDKLSFEQEYLAEDVDSGERPFLYSFEFDKNVSKENLSLDLNLPVWLSFDFNIVPQTCLVAQRLDSDTVHVIQGIRLDNASLYEMCAEIRKQVPGYYTVTGDATGRNRSATNNRAPWEIVRIELEISDGQFQLRRANLDHKTSRVLCNSILEHKKILIDPSCHELIEDCEMAATDEFGKLIKDEMNGLHFFDGFRYLLDAMFPDILQHRI